MHSALQTPLNVFAIQTGQTKVGVPESDVQTATGRAFECVLRGIGPQVPASSLEPSTPKCSETPVEPDDTSGAVVGGPTANDDTGTLIDDTVGSGSLILTEAHGSSDAIPSADRPSGSSHTVLFDRSIEIPRVSTPSTLPESTSEPVAETAATPFGTGLFDRSIEVPHVSTPSNLREPATEPVAGMATASFLPGMADQPAGVAQQGTTGPVAALPEGPEQAPKDVPGDPVRSQPAYGQAYIPFDPKYGLADDAHRSAPQGSFEPARAAFFAQGDRSNGSRPVREMTGAEPATTLELPDAPLMQPSERIVPGLPATEASRTEAGGAQVLPQQSWFRHPTPSEAHQSPITPGVETPAYVAPPSTPGNPQSITDTRRERPVLDATTPFANGPIAQNPSPTLAEAVRPVEPESVVPTANPGQATISDVKPPESPYPVLKPGTKVDTEDSVPASPARYQAGKIPLQSATHSTIPQATPLAAERVNRPDVPAGLTSEAATRPDPLAVDVSVSDRAPPVPPIVPASQGVSFDQAPRDNRKVREIGPEAPAAKVSYGTASQNRQVQDVEGTPAVAPVRVAKQESVPIGAEATSDSPAGQRVATEVLVTRRGAPTAYQFPKTAPENSTESKIDIGRPSGSSQAGTTLGVPVFVPRAEHPAESPDTPLPLAPSLSAQPTAQTKDSIGYTPVAITTRADAVTSPTQNIGMSVSELSPKSSGTANDQPAAVIDITEAPAADGLSPTKSSAEPVAGSLALAPRLKVERDGAVAAETTRSANREAPTARTPLPQPQMQSALQSAFQMQTRIDTFPDPTILDLDQTQEFELDEDHEQDIAARGNEVRQASLSRFNSAATSTVNPFRAMTPQMHEALRQGPSGTIDVRLNPEELGQLKISFTQTDSGLNVVVHAERPDTLDLVRRHVDLLTQDLRLLGYGDISLDFGAPGSGQSETQGDTGTRNQQTSVEDTGMRAPSESAAQAGVRMSHSSGLDLRL